MKQNKLCILFSGILLVLVVVSGCEVVTPPAMYESSPIRISYDLSFGYDVNCTGTGPYEIHYACDTPEVLNGIVTYDILYPYNYTQNTQVNNTFIQWNISGDDTQTYTLGLTAHVEAENYLLADLNGEHAASIQDLQENYPEITKQYIQVQGNSTTRFIDPGNPDIITIATAVQQQVGTNNSFLIAKALFVWLKEHNQYQIHTDSGGVQPAAVTLAKKTGDCDDLSFLYVSLCRACHIPARFIRGYLLINNINGSVSTTPHAWVEVFVGTSVGITGWIPVECACCTQSIDVDVNQNFGVENAFHLRLFTDDGSNESLTLSLSSISYNYGLKRIITVDSVAEASNYHELASGKLVVTPNNSRYYE
jgi:transglutaminase-like putative cysteine protease